MDPNSKKDFVDYIATKTIDELFSILSTIDKSNYPDRYQFITARIQEIKKQKSLRDDYLPKTQISTESTGIELLFIGLPTVFIGAICFWNMINFGFSLDAFLLIAFFSALNFAFYYYAGTFKKVEMDNEYIYVTGRKKHAKIPRNKIASVIEDYSLRNPRVYITFSEATIFGTEIKFSPKSGGLYFFEFKPHELIEVLSKTVNKKYVS